MKEIKVTDIKVHMLRCVYVRVSSNGMIDKEITVPHMNDECIALIMKK